MKLRVLIAPDTYKGSLSAVDAAAAMARGVEAAGHTADILPVADGGEGSLEALISASGGSRHLTTVTGPLGERVAAEWGELPDGTAVVELAQASGLGLVPEDLRDPTRTTTRGTGELLRAALDAGFRSLLLCIGGSATVDGGAGAAQALGVRILDAQGDPVPDGGAGLLLADHLDLSGLDARLADASIEVACDVDNPLLGPSGAAAVYGPQKGATPAQVVRLEEALRRWAELLHTATGVDVADLTGAGAAGGIGAGLVSLCRARLVPGVDRILAACGFDDRLASADLVLTGEGRLDRQTLSGKTVLGVARRAMIAGVPTVALAGQVALTNSELASVGITAAWPLSDGPLPGLESERSAWYERTPALLQTAAERVARIYGAACGAVPEKLKR